MRKAAEVEVGAGTNLLAEFDGKVGVPPGAVTARPQQQQPRQQQPRQQHSGGSSSSRTGKAVTAEAAAAEPRVWLHVCCQSVHATGSPGPWCASCQGKVHSEEHCSQVVRKAGGNEVACKSCVQFRTGNGPCCERWPEAATVATSGQVGSDMGTTGGPIPSDALVRARGKEQLAGEAFLVDLDKCDMEVATVVLEALELRGDQVAEDGNCQFNSIAGTVFNDSSTKAGHMVRRLLCTWVEDSLTHELEGMLPAQSTKEQLLARIGKYEAQVGPEHHGDEDTLMVCALALGVGFLVLKVGSTFEDPHKVCEPEGFSGERFALLFDSTIPHWSGTAAAGQPRRGCGCTLLLQWSFLV